MLKYGKKYYFTTWITEAQQHLTILLEKVVDNYDIDGPLHLTTIFYPYKICQ